MLEPTLVNDAFAAATAPPATSGVDPQAIMYVVGGIVSGIVVGVGALFYRNSPSSNLRSGPQPIQTPASESAQLFFSGTAKEILERLGAAIVILEKLSSLHYETREQIAQHMAQTRHDIRNAVGEDAAEASRENLELRQAIIELQRTVSDTNVKLGLLDQFMRIKVK